MNGTIRLGRIAGFPVDMSWSVLVIVGLITWSTSTAVLPDLTPGYRPAEYWLAGVAAALLFFVSLLAHEVSHAVLARRAGVGVTGLTLWMLGGVATLSGEPRSARDDLRIAGVGPAVSLGLGLGFGLTTVLLAPLGVPELALGVTSWLAVVNLVLGVFNLLPAAPLDGGRVLRAWLWRKHGDRTRAALSAARAGQRTGVVLIGLGVLEVLGGAGVGGLWMALIGWFILNAARAEGSFTATMDALGGLRCADVMTPHPDTLDDAMSLQDLRERGLPWRAHHVYPTVGPDGAASGLLVLAKLPRLPVEAAATTPLRQLAVPLAELTTAAPEESLTEALRRLSPASEGRILVLDAGRLAGIVTLTDLNNAVRRRELAGPRAAYGFPTYGEPR